MKKKKDRKTRCISKQGLQLRHYSAALLPLGQARRDSIEYCDEDYGRPGHFFGLQDCPQRALQARATSDLFDPGAIIQNGHVPRCCHITTYVCVCVYLYLHISLYICIFFEYMPRLAAIYNKVV